MLVQAMLFQASDDGVLVITPCLPLEWVQEPGRLEVERAPTVLGALSYGIEWDAGARNIRLEMSPEWHTPPRFTQWHLPGYPGYPRHPGTKTRVLVDGKDVRYENNPNHVAARGPVSTMEVTRDQ
jgi:hypothetical protein